MRVSLLLLLPRELRDHVWEYVLGSYLIFNTQPERPLAMALRIPGALPAEISSSRVIFDGFNRFSIPALTKIARL